MTEKLLAVISRETGKRATLETNIHDLGIDSLEFLSLLLVIGTEIGNVPDEKIKDINTVGDLANAIEVAG